VTKLNNINGFSFIHFRAIFPLGWVTGATALGGLESSWSTQVANPGGVFDATAPPKCLWRPLEWRPFARNAPLFGAHGSRNRDKNTLK